MLGSVGAQREGKAVEGRLSVPWKSHPLPPLLLPNLSSPFQLSALFSRIIDGACEVQGTRMKMSLDSKTGAMAKGGAAGGTTHAVFIAVSNMRKEKKKNGSDLQSGAT